MAKRDGINKVVLAYSGGLDTSVIVPWLRNNYGGCEVVCFCADLGQEEELEGLDEKARASGASQLVIRDLREEFLRDFIFPTLQAGAVYEREYLLGTSFARPLIARHLVEIAEHEGADAVAHGCTGKGNDQVRFELAVMALNPHLRVIAPWREWDLRSREDALAYAAEFNVPVTQSGRDLYSRDRNLFHTSHEGGLLEDPALEPEERMYMISRNPRDAPEEGVLIEIGFERGLPVSLDGEALAPLPLFMRLNALAGEHGIGRADIVESRLVGMKSHGVYETPAGTTLLRAHRALESITLDRQTMQTKDMLALKYAGLVYDGLWYTRLRESLDAFVQVTQRTVTGSVRLWLYRGNLILAGRESPHSVYRQDFASFGEEEVYNQAHAEGFITLFGLPLKVEAMQEIEREGASRWRQSR